MGLTYEPCATLTPLLGWLASFCVLEKLHEEGSRSMGRERCKTDCCVKSFLVCSQVFILALSRLKLPFIYLAHCDTNKFPLNPVRWTLVRVNLKCESRSSVYPSVVR